MQVLETDCISSPSLSDTLSALKTIIDPLEALKVDTSQLASWSPEERDARTYQIQNLLVSALISALGFMVQLIQQNSSLQQQLVTLISQPPLDKTALVAEVVDQMEQKFEERQLRVEKKNNLVLVGFPEDRRSPNEDWDDRKIVEEVFHRAGADPSVITRVFRLGKIGPSRNDPMRKRQRPIKVLTSSYEQKMVALTGQKGAIQAVAGMMNGQGSRAFLRHDLTPTQLEHDRSLRDQLSSL